MRIDKYIWCVRLSKTRTQASKECNSEKVKLNNDFIKSSKGVKIGDEIAVKRGPIWKSYEVISIPKSRVGAKLVSELIKETTSWEDLEILERVEMQNKQNKQQGIYGRPTKKVRRDIDRFRRDMEE
ncbi:MAG: RNA-binding S4 domain-containing protein [Flavobacteriales bacterium]|nr:RNA-binding S4 domain-containing protein [Flavobacteriales bacterium]